MQICGLSNLYVPCLEWFAKYKISDSNNLIGFSWSNTSGASKPAVSWWRSTTGMLEQGVKSVQS